MSILNPYSSLIQFNWLIHKFIDFVVEISLHICFMIDMSY
jgi:hypothetical protein